MLSISTKVGAFKTAAKALEEYAQALVAASAVLEETEDVWKAEIAAGSIRYDCESALASLQRVLAS